MASDSWLDAEWRHHDLSNPVLAAASLYAIEAAASLVHHNGDIDAVALAAATAYTGATWVRDHHFWLQVYLTVATIVSLAWVLYAEHVSPFTMRAVTAFGIGAVALGILYPVAAFVDRRDKRRTSERLSAGLRRKAERGDWPAMFAALGARDVTQLGEPVENRVGSTLTFRLPPNGKWTFTRVAMLTDQLETIQDLPARTIRLRPGPSAAVFHVDLRTRDVLSEVIPYEIQDGPVSINDPFSLGLDEFGEDIEILLREITAMVFAPKRSGKSNLLWVILAALLRCEDVMIWFIDLKGGRTAKPWLTPWFEGRTARPALDWVATTHEESLLMLQCSKKAIDHRATTGDGEKITPSGQQPAILLISDETASLVGLSAGRIGTALRDLLADIVGRGGSEAVDTLLAFLRATISNTGTSDLKANAKLRITLGANSAADATSATDNPGKGRQVAEFKHKGTMFVEGDRGEGRVGRSRRIEFENIPEIAEAYSEWRPELEADLELVLGDAYAKRWSLERSGHLLPSERQKELGIVPSKAAPVSEGTTTTATKPMSALPTIPPPPKDAKPAFRTVDGRPIARPLDENTVKEMFADLEEQLSDLGKTAPHKGRTRMLGLIFEAGAAGIAPGDLTDKLNGEEISCVRQTVHEWLKDEVGNGSIVNRGGNYITKDNQ
jgi:hypothetical protein